MAIKYQGLKSDQKLLGVKIIGWSVVISNILIALIRYILPPAVPVAIPVKVTQLISILAVYPWDLFSGILQNFWVSQWIWVLVLFLCGADLLRFNKFARMIFILANILQVVTLAYLVVTKFGNPAFMDYFFKLYFHLVVNGTYVGFMTLAEVRERFGIIIEGSQIRTWIRNWRRRWNRKPKDAKDYFNLGLSYRKLERVEEALEALAMARQINPRDVNAGFEYGVTLAAVKRFDEAIRAWKDVLKVDPFHREAYRQLAAAYRETGCSKEAVRILEKIIPFNRQNAEFYRDLAESYLAVGDPERSVENFQKASELDPRDHWPLLAGGRIYLEQLDQPDQALTLLRRAVQKNPGDPRGHFYAGLACLKLNRYKEALLCFKECIKLNESDKDAHYQLGFTYAMIEDYSSARREYDFLSGIDQDLAQNLKLLIK